MEDAKEILFRKFINDECTSEEVEQLLHYIQHSENDTTYKGLMDQVWLKLKEYPQVSEQVKTQQFDIILEQSRNQRAREANTSSFFGRYGMQLAATFIGFLVISSILYFFFLTPAQRTYETGFGETMTIVLPDGSDVVLNSNSRLQYDTDWRTDEKRKVALNGEAFFSVVHTPDDRKFTVITTDEVQVEVLGTQFNVHNRRNTTEVVLNEGKVKVHINAKEGQQEVLMEPGEWVAYSQATQQYQKKLINTKTYTSWKDRMLIFENQSLAEIALTLEDSYGYTIRFSDEKIKDYQFTGTLPTDKINVLFTMLAKSFDLKIEQKGKELWIQPNKK
ncbi:MAG: FecR domain-containing protein [Cyclobacteriaceae bacterium]